MHGAQEPEPRFEVAIDHLQGDTEGSRSLYELLPIARFADRGGRHRDHAFRARSIRDGAEIPEGLDRPVDRVRPEPVVVAQLAAETQRGARILEHVEVLARTQAEDDHPGRVRADIHDREPPVVPSRPQAGLHGRMLPHETTARGRTVRAPRVCSSTR